MCGYRYTKLWWRIQRKCWQFLMEERAWHEGQTPPLFVFLCKQVYSKCFAQLFLICFWSVLIKAQYWRRNQCSSSSSDDYCSLCDLSSTLKLWNFKLYQLTNPLMLVHSCSHLVCDGLFHIMKYNLFFLHSRKKISEVNSLWIWTQYLLSCLQVALLLFLCVLTVQM